MKKSICSAVAILFCIFCVSGVSAFTYDEEARISQSDLLNPGEFITVSMNINILPGTVDATGCVNLETDLEEVIWLYNLYVGGYPISDNNPGAGQLFTIPGDKLTYDEPVLLRIYLTGKVPNVNVAEIKVMSITQTPAPASGEAFYSISARTALYDTAPDSTITAAPTKTVPAQTTIPAQPTPVPTKSPVSVIATAVGLLGAAFVFSRK